jgi:hypothetical protein
VGDGSFKTFDELVTWATWEIITAFTSGNPLRQTVYGILMAARNLEKKP